MFFSRFFKRLNLEYFKPLHVFVQFLLSSCCISSAWLKHPFVFWMMICSRRDKCLKFLWHEVLDFPIKEHCNCLPIMIRLGIGHQRDVLIIAWKGHLWLPIDVMVSRTLFLKSVQLFLSVLHGELASDKPLQFRRCWEHVVIRMIKHQSNSRLSKFTCANGRDRRRMPMWSKCDDCNTKQTCTRYEQTPQRHALFSVW